MTKEEKTLVIEELAQKFTQFEYFYVTDSSALTVDQINTFRKFCFEKGVEYKVFKNTLIAKALNKLNNADYSEFNDKVLVGTSGILFSANPNLPAKLLNEFKTKSKIDKIVFKGASISTAFYIGQDQLKSLENLKSKNELLGEIIGLLQSPAKNVLGALLSGERKLAGIVKAIADKKEKEN
ncbi:MAG: 50S ribosomal protein L10 [Bacteroidota bacterium]|nr:50S ribosomal protein L10 [Bacteroidota bacterium]